jgi:hypothetical protein
MKMKIKEKVQGILLNQGIQNRKKLICKIIIKFKKTYKKTLSQTYQKTIHLLKKNYQSQTLQSKMIPSTN